MKPLFKRLLPMGSLAILLASSGLLSASDMQDRIQASTKILDEKQHSAHPIPSELINHAKGEAIFSVTKAGLGIGGQGGEGLIVLRLGAGTSQAWTAPSAFNLGGASIDGTIPAPLSANHFIRSWKARTRPASERDGRSKPQENTTAMIENNAVVAIYPSHIEAENAIKELEHFGCDLKKLSIVSRDFETDEKVIGYYNTGERMKYWGKLGVFWGAIWGSLFGSAFFLVPGFGPLLAAGPLVTWIISALESAAVVGGLSALGAGLFSLGIPKNSVLQYETEVGNGKFLLLIHGTEQDAAHASKIIAHTSPDSYTTHMLSPTAETALAIGV